MFVPFSEFIPSPLHQNNVERNRTPYGRVRTGLNRRFDGTLDLATHHTN